MLIQNQEITEQAQLPDNCTDVEFDNVFFNLDKVEDLNFSRTTINPNCTFKEGMTFVVCNFVSATYPEGFEDRLVRCQIGEPVEWSPPEA